MKLPPLYLVPVATIKPTGVSSKEAAKYQARISTRLRKCGVKTGIGFLVRRSDSEELEQALRDISANIVEYSGAIGGRIDIQIAVTTPDQSIERVFRVELRTRLEKLIESMRDGDPWRIANNLALARELADLLIDGSSSKLLEALFGARDAASASRASVKAGGPMIPATEAQISQVKSGIMIAQGLIKSEAFAIP